MNWFIVFSLYLTHQCAAPLELIAHYSIGGFRQYKTYHDVYLIYFKIPTGTHFASIEMKASEKNSGCSPQKLMVYMKRNGFPIVNPDNSKLPSNFKNTTKLHDFCLEMASNESVRFINMSEPEPGFYFMAFFLPYSDPRYNTIRPPELKDDCRVGLEASLSVEWYKSITQIFEGVTYMIHELSSNLLLYYTFFVPELVKHAALVFEDINMDFSVASVEIWIQSRRLPSKTSYIISKTLLRKDNESSFILFFKSQEDNWHFLKILVNGLLFSMQNFRLSFTLRYFREKLEIDNVTTARLKIFQSDVLTRVVPYQQHNLVQDISSAFTFSYRLRHKSESSNTIDITNEGFVALQFQIHEHTDIGGILNFVLSFTSKNATAILVACLRSEILEIPIWPDFCFQYDNEHVNATLILNRTRNAASLMIPYPQSGTWYVTFKLSCDPCYLCICPERCQNYFENCMKKCELMCYPTNRCSDCFTFCKKETFKWNECDICDCEGFCIRNKTHCNATVDFNLNSQACPNHCGEHGKCVYVISSGITYATCVCSYNYRGWDCSDDSLATSYNMLLLELLLLVLSNLTFLLTIYVACYRKYYVEAIVYTSILIFSTFYHACDAGEEIVSFCITSIEALQFADFHCALLGIWVTIIAIADLPSYWPSLCHMTGAAILPFTTAIDKTALWAYALPTIPGIIIVAISWFLKWLKFRQLFLNKRYICIYGPLGIIFCSLGLLIFMLLQTSNNYKYLHSTWHCIMAIAIILLLPTSTTFKQETI